METLRAGNDALLGLRLDALLTSQQALQSAFQDYHAQMMKLYDCSSNLLAGHFESPSRDDTGMQDVQRCATLYSQFASHEMSDDPVRTFETESAVARKTYLRKKEQSIGLFDRATASHLAREYQFQYKFYSDKMYQIETEDSTINFESWDWTWEQPATTDIDAHNAFHQSGHGPRLMAVVRQRKAELMEALFPSRTSYHIQSMSWPELEYSYGLHLKRIIIRAGFRTINNLTGFTDSNVILVIIEIGRFFAEINKSCRPKELPSGNMQGANEPLINHPWPAKVRKQYTFNELYRRCHCKGLLNDWVDQKIQRFSFKNRTCTRMSDRTAGMTYLWETLISIMGEDHDKSEVLAGVHEDGYGEFIIDFLNQVLPQQPENILEQADDATFKASELNISALETFGGISIIWTDRLDDHLLLSPSSRTLKLFWDTSLLDQSPLFWCKTPYLQNTQQNPAKSNLSQELRTTYRLIFHNAKARHFRSKETCAVNANKGLGIAVHDLRVDLNSRRAKKILKYLLRSPVHSKLQRDNHRDNQFSRIFKHSSQIWWPIGRTLNFIQQRFQRHQTTPDIASFLALGPPYPLDLCWHLENLLLPYPEVFNEKYHLRSFASFPWFGPRLRELKFFMDTQRPTGWYQMWKDKRDIVQYVTFWAVLIFGTISVALAFGSLLVGSAQTAAAFRALKQHD